jgi:hypothetical protein
VSDALRLPPLRAVRPCVTPDHAGEESDTSSGFNLSYLKDQKLRTNCCEGQEDFYTWKNNEVYVFDGEVCKARFEGEEATRHLKHLVTYRDNFEMKIVNENRRKNM